MIIQISPSDAVKNSPDVKATHGGFKFQLSGILHNKVMQKNDLISTVKKVHFKNPVQTYADKSTTYTPNSTKLSTSPSHVATWKATRAGTSQRLWDWPRKGKESRGFQETLVPSSTEGYSKPEIAVDLYQENSGILVQR
jgi:hypothetical protein